MVYILASVTHSIKKKQVENTEEFYHLAVDFELITNNDDDNEEEVDFCEVLKNARKMYEIRFSRLK